jgi:hypothetical protein
MEVRIIHFETIEENEQELETRLITLLEEIHKEETSQSVWEHLKTN